MELEVLVPPQSLALLPVDLRTIVVLGFGHFVGHHSFCKLGFWVHGFSTVFTIGHVNQATLMIFRFKNFILPWLY